jgi:hypothetical protein
LEKAVADRPITVAFVEFKSSFERHKSNLDRPYRQESLAFLEGVFNFIRLCRNEVGHAISPQTPARPVVQAQLALYSDYARRIYELADYLKGLQPGTI